eukprot:11523492-Heterocapsa_arctica.AAC.1
MVGVAVVGGVIAVVGAAAVGIAVVGVAVVGVAIVGVAVVGVAVVGASKVVQEWPTELATYRPRVIVTTTVPTVVTRVAQVEVGGLSGDRATVPVLGVLIH